MENLQNQEQITGAISNIKVPGIATMAYWNIIRSTHALYFILSSNALGLGVGTNNLMMIASVAGDVVASHKAKKGIDKSLPEILSQAQNYFYLTPDQFGRIKIKKGLFGGKTIVPNGKEKSWKEKGYVKFKLSGKKFKAFLQMIQG